MDYLKNAAPGIHNRETIIEYMTSTFPYRRQQLADKELSNDATSFLAEYPRFQDFEGALVLNAIHLFKIIKSLFV